MAVLPPHHDWQCDVNLGQGKVRVNLEKSPDFWVTFDQVNPDPQKSRADSFHSCHHSGSVRKRIMPN